MRIESAAVHDQLSEPDGHGLHRPCPACGALVKVPMREEASDAFACPSCHVHLSLRGDHVQLFWNHRDAEPGRDEHDRSG
jgi:uncharacterized paraquat-inducible protein A